MYLKMFVTKGNVIRVFSVMTRQIHSYPIMFGNVNKQAKTMAKLMTGSHRKKKNWYSAEIVAKSPILPTNKAFQQGSQSKRRVDVLNKLFMRSITDLLASGEVASDLIGREISITKVKVTADFTAVNVYWTAKGTIRDAEMDKILEKAGFELRHNLCQLHVMGRVPRICFVADKGQIILEETLQYLENARSKDGYVSEDLAEKMKSECVLEAPIEPEILAKINHLEEDLDVDPVPTMTHNVLGLDHAAIMTKIERAVKKSEAKHRQNVLNDIYMEPHIGGILAKDNDIHPSDIARYIAKQKNQKKKAQQVLLKQFLAEMELPEKPSDEEYIDMEDGDFIEEFEDIMKNGVEITEK